MKRMKKILTLAVVLMTTLALFAQEEKDVTKFLGIPVDGYKSEMISKLKAKGFTETNIDGCLEGIFNNYPVLITVNINPYNNKVYEISLLDIAENSESEIRYRFNNLISQFENNSNYIGGTNEYISEEEDLGHNIANREKIYQAIFFQESGSINKEIDYVMWEKYGVKGPEDLPEEEKKEASEYLQNYINNYIKNRLSKKRVTFFIIPRDKKYHISMSYTNCYNEPNGEDL